MHLCWLMKTRLEQEYGNKNMFNANYVHANAYYHKAYYAQPKGNFTKEDTWGRNGFFGNDLFGKRNMNQFLRMLNGVLRNDYGK